jgi:dTDP-4-amino-4,6-dideoxygalactose transaminase
MGGPARFFPSQPWVYPPLLWRAIFGNIPKVPWRNSTEICFRENRGSPPRDRAQVNQTAKPRRIFLSPPHMGAEEMLFIQEAFESNYIAPLGPMVDAFERDFVDKVGIGHAVAVSSGTAGMHLALHVLGVGPGDEIFASTLTFIGSVTPILFQGATPVFIDSDRYSWCMDTSLLTEELEVCKKAGKLPKAVVPTDLYGHCCDYDRILGVCDKYGVAVIADAAEAMGSRYKSDLRPHLSHVWNHAGKWARAAVFSFNGNKIITTSGGGMLASDDRDLIEQARFLSQQARDPAPHYEHSEIGYNYRMSNILAAIGRGQLRVLDERVKRRREIFDYYHRELKDLPGIEFMPEAPYGKSNRWLSVISITPQKFGADREQVRLALEAENIEARPVWKPMHLQPVFDPQITQISTDSFGKERYPCRVVGGEVAEDLFDRGLCLPSGTAMTNGDLDRIISAIRNCRK